MRLWSQLFVHNILLSIPKWFVLPMKVAGFLLSAFKKTYLMVLIMTPKMMLLVKRLRIDLGLGKVYKNGIEFHRQWQALFSIECGIGI